jgi:ribosome-associated heat shock protein Hsp15
VAAVFVLKSPAKPKSSANPARVDRWLWAVRVFKTRSLAASACRQGRVKVDDITVKPARELRVGETVVVRDGPDQRIVVVRDYPGSRVGAKLVPDFCDDRTPPKPKPEEQIASGDVVWARERGAGRPTKRDRRRLLDILDSP